MKENNISPEFLFFLIGLISFLVIFGSIAYYQGGFG